MEPTQASSPPESRPAEFNPFDDVETDLDAAGRSDLIERLAIPVPNVVTVDILGFPAEDAPRVAGWANEVMFSDWVLYNRNEVGEGFDGFPAFRDYIDAHIAA